MRAALKIKNVRKKKLVYRINKQITFKRSRHSKGGILKIMRKTLKLIVQNLVQNRYQMI